MGRDVGCCVVGLFFFFKQKTAYELRISDWSSDVCSSDLQAPGEINVQNAFLRDVFVCMMIAPLLVRLPSIALGAMLAGVFAWCIEGWQLYLLLCPQTIGRASCRERVCQYV